MNNTHTFMGSKSIRDVVPCNLASSFNIRNENLQIGSTVHFNPLCPTNKILLNKEKLNKGTIRSKNFAACSSEKIYYNPKFLSRHIKTSANIYLKPCDQLPSFQNEIPKTADTNIHINRNYLVNLNDTLAINPNNPENTNSKTFLPAIQSRGGIHVNPKFFKQKQVEKNESGELARVDSSSYSFATIEKHTPPKIEKNLEPSNISGNKNLHKLDIQTKSKYKLIKNSTASLKNESSSKSLCFKTKYSLKRCVLGKEGKLNSRTSENLRYKAINNYAKNKIGRKCASEFKKLSSTKLVRKSILQSVILARRHSRNSVYKKCVDVINQKKIQPRRKTTNITYFPKNNDHIVNDECEIVNNSFRRLSKMKIVRRSFLKEQIERRTQVKKKVVRERRNLTKSFISKFKIRHSSERVKLLVEQRLLKWGKKKQALSSPTVISRRRTHPSKTFRKNNQPCPFYNRFGRCKGKDRGTCPKLHDPKYISICRKLLQGECTQKDCLLSHDICPGKMPTCHHYLAGLCTRSNCPFLHIKVNPKAPICTSFLQGYCPDVHNCLKRHEFICPIFAEKGACSRGKSCTYPHRYPVVHSKLLKDDQKPLLHRSGSTIDNNRMLKEVNGTIANAVDCEDRIPKKEKLSDSGRSKRKPKKEFVKEPFRRYFAMSSTSEDSNDSNESLLNTNSVSNENRVDEFR